ncbi:hypothetical protein BASA81_012473 [Batrachochytrium salamandrivorans]|nr:hypothetical protein BASA81_012473 [Batrachochytrium salamandrivorans]
MLFSESSTEALKHFLVSELEVISDADATVLADYVVALLKHDKAVASLKEDCLVELADFLADETEAFVQRLFNALARDEFSDGPATTFSDAIELSNISHEGVDTRDSNMDGSLNAKRSRDDVSGSSESHAAMGGDGDVANTHTSHHDGDRPEKVARLSTHSYGNDRHHDTESSRQSSRSDFSTKWHDGSRDNKQATDRRFRSRDDRDVRTGSTRNAQFDGRRGRCFNYDAKGFCLRGDSCPYEHGSEALLIDNLTASARQPSIGGAPMLAPGLHAGVVPGMNAGAFPPMGNRGVDPSLGSNFRPSFNPAARTSWAPRGGMSNGRGGMGGYQAQKRQRRSDTTLIVENIPPESCAMDKVNEYFKAFGTLTNIQVDPETKRATIQYSKTEEAQSAYRSPDPIFGNRFVKVYWQTETTGGSSGSASLQGKGSDVVPTTGSIRPHGRLDTHQTNGTAGGGGGGGGTGNAVSAQDTHRTAADDLRRLQQEKTKAMLELHKTQEALIAKRIGEQKRIMERLENDKTLSSKDRKDLLLSVKALSLHTQSIVASAATQTQSVKARTVTSAAKPVGTEGTTVQTTLAGTTEGEKVDPALQAQLLALKGEAQSLGITDPTDTTTAASSVSGRGRGRGGWSRGRGGHASRAFNIDNRSTKILIKNISDTNVDALRAHFEALSGCVGFQKVNEESAFASYQMRWQAEKAMISQLTSEGCAGVELQWATVGSTDLPPQ